jgi:hypothetical protein
LRRIQVVFGVAYRRRCATDGKTTDAELFIARPPERCRELLMKWIKRKR